MSKKNTKTEENVGRLEKAEKCEASSLMGEKRSTVAVSPLVRKRSGGVLWSLSCSESSFTWYLLLAVGGMLGESRGSIKDVDCWRRQLIK